MRGYWSETDLDLRESLKLYPEPEMAAQQREARHDDRKQLLAALEREGLIATDARARAESSAELPEALALAIQVFLARSPSALMMVQLEDLLGQVEQVNLPGTIDAYPNWRHKVPVDIEDWSGCQAIAGIAETLGRERAANSRGPGAG